MKRSKRRVFTRPVIIVELVVILLLAGIGVAYALPQNTITPSTEPWAGTAAITESGDLSVTDYSFIYNSELTQVTGVTVEVTNGDTSDHTADIKVAVLDDTPLFQEDGEVTGQTCTASAATDIDVTLDNSVDLEDVDTLNIIVIDNG
jgi:hypothetical protein